MPQTVYSLAELQTFGQELVRNVVDELRQRDAPARSVAGLKPRYRLRDVAKAWGKDERTILKALEEKKLFLPLQETRDIVVDAEGLDAYILENEVDGNTILERLRARRRKDKGG